MGEKYIDFIDVFEDFYPVYDISNEAKDYWKRFIPTDSFKELLRRFLDSLESASYGDKKSIFLQGRYGVGKSHATGVIKHLLWDPWDEIVDYVNNINDSQLRKRLEAFRQKNRVFPVTIKGVSTISNPRDLKLTLEKAVKEALRKENISLLVKSDFEKYIDSINSQKFFDWDSFIQNNIQLRSLVRDKNELIEALENEDESVLERLEDSLTGLAPVLPSIEDWLEEVAKELKGRNLCSAICIYWDEFTPVFDLPQNTVILNIIQSIAEKTTSSDVFLFLVSHRHPTQAKIDEDIEKVIGRFHYKEYRMEEITTFHIMGSITKKKDLEKWQSLKNEIFNRDLRLNNLLNELTEGNTHYKEALKDVFPIHPYTAYLAIKLSEYVGSTERSIFRFYYDKERGFLKFIKENPEENDLSGQYFLTADYLWDFFMEDFQRGSGEKARNVLDKYRYIENIKKEGKHYEAIYKGILLLNILTSYTDFREGKEGKFLPSEENIRRMFIGTAYEKYIDEVLKYVDSKGYIPRTPDGLFLVSSTPLPPEEISRQKEILNNEYSRDILKAFNAEIREEFEKIFQDNVLRPVEVVLVDANVREFDLERKLSNEFKKPYALHVVVFLPKFEEDIKGAQKLVENIAQKNFNLVKDVIFVIPYEALGNKRYETLIDYKARAIVSERHNFNEEKQRNEEYANKILEEWINRIEKGSCRIICGDYKDTIYVSSFSEKLNDEISQRIFRFGPDNIKDLKNNINIWKYQRSETPIEMFLYAENLKELEDKAKNQLYRSLLGLLKNVNGEYIVDNSLKLKETVDPDHPIVKICREVANVINKREGDSFNLGDNLRFLIEPPYGVYTSLIGSAILGFVLRPYVDRLYEVGTGRRIDKTLMKEKIISLVKYLMEGKEGDKLNVRLGTFEEKEVAEILRDLFSIKEHESLNKVRWSIRAWIKEKGYPLWSLKELDLKDKRKIELFVDSITFLIKNPDKEISQDGIKKICSLLKINRTDLNLVLKPDKLKEGFKNWVKKRLRTLEGSQLSEEELEDIRKYIMQKMEEEIGLWDENKVEIVLKDYEKEKGKNLIEKSVIKNLSEIFNIQGVYDFNTLREKIKEKINQDIGYPLWIFEGIFNKDIMGVCDKIQDFLSTGEKLAEETLQEIVDGTNQYLSFLTLNLKFENGKIALKNWLEKNGEKDIERYSQFLRENIQKPPYYWTEKDLKEILIKYQFVKELSDVFNIDFRDKVDEFKSKLKSWIEKQNYPFWSFALEDEIGKKFVEVVSNFVKANYSMPEDFYREATNFIKENKQNIKSMLLEIRAKANFEKWIRDIIRFELDNNELEKLIEDVRRNNKVEDYYWEKSTIENYILRNKEKYISEKKKEMVKSKVQETNKDLRLVLLKLIEEYPSVCDILEKLLE